MKNLQFYIVQTFKFLLLKILTFHVRKIKTGILLIRNDNLGDFLISLPLFEQIAKHVHAQNKTVTIVVSEAMADFCRKFPYFDNVISLSGSTLNGFASRIKSYRLITKYHAEKIILFHALGRSGEYDYMALLPKSKERYALETMNVWPVPDMLKKYRTLFFNRKYTHLIAYDISKLLSYNETELVRHSTGYPIEQRLADINVLRPFPTTRISNTPYYLLVPGSSSAIRQWPAENFASLVDRLNTSFPDLTPVLIGSKKDMAAVDKVYHFCHCKDKLINLCGKTTLEELFSIIEQAEFLITNDTGTYHIAPLVNTLTFCIGGSWHFGAYGPNPHYPKSIFLYAEMPCKRCLENCKYKTGDIFPCLDQVTDTCVFEHIMQNYKI